MKLKNLSFFILAPYLIGYSPSDSSYDEYSLGLGKGQYATYGCTDATHPDRGPAHLNSYSDIGVKFTHKFEAPFRVGLTTSIISDKGITLGVAYPDIAYDSKYYSFGTTGVRLGLEDGTYGEISFFDQIPVFSGKGFARIGVGLKPTDRTRLWLGVNAFPYDNRGISGQFDFPISTNHFLFINSRYGVSGSVPEYGLSVGARIRIFSEDLKK
jgi:hypothetical protein